ncbi:membrane dipeptidase [Gelidibacter algens]|uniref:Membrane dipeptidase n=2 Tax=Gelidibacter algens TaxID=49280 RepID=A0A327SC69_9FLAO|nr:membrane dipeptidase [Gelidibacter algens]
MLSLSLITLFMSCKTDNKKMTDTNSSQDSIALIERAKAIHERVITLDTHCDFNVKNFTDSTNYTQDLESQVTLPKMNQGGLDVAWFIVYTGQEDLTDEGFKKAHETAMGKFNAIHKLVDDFAPEQIELALTSDDVRRIVKSGKKVAMIGIENGYSVGTDITNVEKFYDLGGRYMSLAHNGHSQLSDSNTGELDSIWLHNGLSALGKQVITEMNRVGMMIDVSHPSKEAMRAMIDLSPVPLIASHSSARALCDHSRNLDDEQLEWLKKNGGVVQAVAFSAYLNTEKHEKYAAFKKEIALKIMDSMNVAYLERSDLKELSEEERDAYYSVLQKVNPLVDAKLKTMKNVPEAVNVSDFIDHIDYMVNKIGIEHVGISSDFDGGGGIEGWKDASETFNVTLELVKRGYTEEQIAMLWSGNLLRVLDAVQAFAKNMQS